MNSQDSRPEQPEDGAGRKDDEEVALRLIASAHKRGAGKPMQMLGSLQPEVGFAALSVLDPGGAMEREQDEAELRRLNKAVTRQNNLIALAQRDLVPVVEHHQRIKAKRPIAAKLSRTFCAGGSEEAFAKRFVQPIASNGNGGTGLWESYTALADAIESGYRARENSHKRCADCLRSAEKPPSSKNLRQVLIPRWIKNEWLKVMILSAPKASKM